MRVRAVLIHILVLAAAGVAEAGVWRVEQDGTGDFTEIQPAVDASASGDTILIGPGYYTEQSTHAGLDGWTACAFWDDTRDLTFIGAGRDQVTVGVDTYDPSRFEAGIVVSGAGVLRVEEVRLSNLRVGVSSGYGEIYVSRSEFDTCYWGVGSEFTERCVVSSCSFGSIEKFSVTLYSSQDAEIDDCTMDSALINFNDSRGVVRNCEVTGGDFVSFYLSRGTVENCTVRCDDDHPCIYVSDSDTVRFYDNVIEGGNTNLTATGLNVNVFAERNSFSDPALWNFNFRNSASVYAHDNHIQRAFDFIQEYIVYTAFYSHSLERTIDMSNNYWFADGNLGRLDDLIYDGNDDHTLNIFVDYEPIRTEPVANEPTSLGSFKSLYR